MKKYLVIFHDRGGYNLGQVEVDANSFASAITKAEKTEEYRACVYQVKKLTINER